MKPLDPHFEIALARTPEDVAAAQRLRYDVFVTELGGDGPMVDHGARLERDRFDAFADHLLLRADGAVVGVYRLLREPGARAAGQFYTEDEYDLSGLRASGRPLLELGRSCLHRDFRGGAALYHLWRGLAGYVEEHGIEVMFGTASFHGTDPARHAQPLSLLHHRHAAPAALRVRSQAYQPMDLIAADALDRKAAMLQIPPLLKAYLRLGATVGDGAYVDHAFNTTDVCVIIDTARLNAAQSAHYTRR